MIGRYTGILLLIVALTMVPSLVLAVALREHAPVIGFVSAIVASALIGIPLAMLKVRSRRIRARDGFVLVAVAWILISILGALPFYISREIPSLVDSLFETVSGFTTTGSSILTDVEALSKSTLLWRSFTHWLGGMGVLVFFLAIIPMTRGNGESLMILRAESPGPQVDKLVPKTAKSAQILYLIYTGLTVAEIILLLLGNMPIFDAVCTAFGTAGTGGFGVKNTSIGGYSPYIQYVVTVFMILFGVNFSVYFAILLKQASKAFRNEELRVYFAIIGISIVIIGINIWKMYAGNLEEVFRHAAFQVASIMTTTGFGTTDFNVWPQLSRMILLLLMIVGACAGSTGGGMKVSRIIILFKGMGMQMQKLIRPNRVNFVRITQEVVPNETVSGVFAYAATYCLIAILSVLVVSLDQFSFETNFTAVLACLNNIGPGLDMVGSTGNYSAFSAISKIVLSLNMLLGRLEIYPILICFLPSTWKREKR
ncbi:MAG: TrkH family potassium uptake protein [Clostridia bacterium]|nr:TrkH family potassium uptake protein [Clostridia bacterium]